MYDLKLPYEISVLDLPCSSFLSFHYIIIIMKIKSSNYVVCVDKYIYKINIKCMTSSRYTKFILLPYFNICLSTIVY